MKKIGYVINYIEKNGPSSVLVNIINNLNREEFEPSLITLFEGNNQDVIEELKNKDVKIFECKNLSRSKCLLDMASEFKDLVAREGFDILHAHGIIPDIVISKTNVKKVSTIHEDMFEFFPSIYGKFKANIFINLHLKAMKKIDENICCSKTVYDVMNPYLNNVSYIRNGIPPKTAGKLSRKDLNISENAKVFIYAGVLDDHKNISWLIENFVKYHNENEYMLVLGEGPKKEECLSKKDDHIVMLGFKNNPLDYMAISDIYISASKTEGLSISAIEAMSQGLGLFVSDIPSHNELVNISDVYVGETFTEDNFEKALNKIRNSKIDRNLIKEVQLKELSAEKMAKEYEVKYRD